MSDDPYQPPAESAVAEMTDQSPWPTIRRIFLAWEKLRLLYNAILIPWTLIGIGSAWPLSNFVLVEIVFCGFAANVLFLAAPAVESYIAWLGFESPMIRWGLFIAGTLFTMLLAAAVVLSVAHPNL